MSNTHTLRAYGLTTALVMAVTLIFATTAGADTYPLDPMPLEDVADSIPRKVVAPPTTILYPPDPVPLEDVLDSIPTRTADPMPVEVVVDIPDEILDALVIVMPFQVGFSLLPA